MPLGVRVNSVSPGGMLGGTRLIDGVSRVFLARPAPCLNKARG